jgi:predicted nucleic acid-binding protein
LKREDAFESICPRRFRRARLDARPARASQARDLIIAAATPVVPALWQYEVSNAIAVAERRGRLTAAQVGTLAADLEDFIEVVEIDSIRVRASVLMETARRTRLTVYDAAYLELALRRRLPLATLDDKLRESARRSGLTLI